VSTRAHQTHALRPSGANARAPAEAPPIVHEVLRSPGRPLDASARAFMEPRFGHDFSHVRVHTGARASDSAVAVHALAYTVRSDVVFGAGQYTLHHWKLASTSRGLLVIALLLAPLNLLLLANRARTHSRNTEPFIGRRQRRYYHR